MRVAGLYSVAVRESKAYEDRKDQVLGLAECLLKKKRVIYCREYGNTPPILWKGVYFV